MDSTMTRWIARVGLAIIAVAAAAIAPAFTFLAIPSSASAAAQKLPNPCALAAAKLVAPALGLKVAPSGTLSAASTEDKCTWTHGKITLFVSIQPYQKSGGFSGPPGMVVEHDPAGLGSGGVFAYDANPKYLFSNASFAKGAYSVTVHSNGPNSPSSVLALARGVYSATP